MGMDLDTGLLQHNWMIFDEFAEEHAGRDADLAPESTGDGLGERADEGIVAQRADPIGRRGPFGEKVAHATSDLAQRRDVEPEQTQLDRARVVEAGVGGEVGGEALRERW